MSIKSAILEFFNPRPTISFKSIFGAYNIPVPVVEARKVFPEWARSQLEAKEVKFVRCPGMFDLSQAGYLICAHADIHIKANKQGVIIRTNVPPQLQPEELNHTVVAGLAPFKDSVKINAHKIPLPWGIFCKPGYSAYVLPALFHSPFLDKIYVYPGIVDYDTFPTVNLMISVLEECDFTIWAGTPLLQVMPYKREVITAECGKGTEEDKDKYHFTFYSKLPNLYKKKFHMRKQYTIKNI